MNTLPESPSYGQYPQGLSCHEVVSLPKAQPHTFLALFIYFFNCIFSRRHWDTFVTMNFYLLNLTCIQFSYYFISPNI